MRKIIVKNKDLEHAEKHIPFSRSDPRFCSKENFKKCIYGNLRLHSYAETIKGAFRGDFFNISFAVKDIVVCGMPRSGSTLLYNIIREIITNNQPTVDRYFSDASGYKKLLKSEVFSNINKTHSFSPLLAKRIEKEYTLGFFSHRDVRDIIVSLMQKGRIMDIEDWLNTIKLEKLVNDSILLAKIKNMTIISYQDMVEKKEEVILNISKKLNIILKQDEIKKIVEKTSIRHSREIVEKIQVEKEYDIKTQLHHNHIADGRVGKWKQILDEKQINIINKRAKRYLTLFSYNI
ncbi:MAG: sulfotransferase domain-containing protein [Ignavibacteriae bacterium]|nr:sulfotransferase domain-containing protein [Ignavibacteriota bacterium]